MARGEDTGSHPGRQVSRYRRVSDDNPTIGPPKPVELGGMAVLRNAAGVPIRKMSAEYNRFQRSQPGYDRSGMLPVQKMGKGPGEGLPYYG